MGFAAHSASHLVPRVRGKPVAKALAREQRVGFTGGSGTFLRSDKEGHVPTASARSGARARPPN